MIHNLYFPYFTVIHVTSILKGEDGKPGALGREGKPGKEVWSTYTFYIQISIFLILIFTIKLKYVKSIKPLFSPASRYFKVTTFLVGTCDTSCLSTWEPCLSLLCSGLNAQESVWLRHVEKWIIRLCMFVLQGPRGAPGAEGLAGPRGESVSRLSVLVGKVALVAERCQR